MKHSRQIISITNAAVDALSSARDDDKGKRTELSTGSPTPPSGGTKEVSIEPSLTASHRQSSQECSNYGKTSFTVDYRLSEEAKKNSSPSLLDLSFNGTQRVRVPSRLLREIKSPLERSSSSAESRENLRICNVDGDHESATPVKVIRHVNGPSAWILSNEFRGILPNPADSLTKPSIDHESSKITQHCLQESSFTRKCVSEDSVKDLENETADEVVHERKQKNLVIKGLHQGKPHSGAPVFTTLQDNACDVKIKRFALSDKERSVKDQFLKRQDLKKPTKKLVQPTLVPSEFGERKNGHKEADGADNSVVTAAAVAAAAASAAAGPFIQLHHSLETQIAALVSNLQVLQSRQQIQQDKDKESELQHQMEERLHRLEELQAKMLHTQTIQAAPVSAPISLSYPVISAEAPLPTCNTTASAYVGGPTYHQAVGMAWPATEGTQTHCPDPHSIHAKIYDPTEVHSFTQSMPAFEKHKKVRNIRTQTSPQESVLSEESPLQTPLPRKQPPMPMSRYDLPRSRLRGHRPRSDVTRREEKQGRVHFKPDVSSSVPSHIRKITEKGRGLVPRELVSENGFASSSIDKARLEPQRRSDSAFAQSCDTQAMSNEVGKIKNDVENVLIEMKSLKQELIDHQLHKDDVPSHYSTSNFKSLGPSPLDEYLVATGRTAATKLPTTSTGVLPSMPFHLTHLADAEHILQDVQNRRENLEKNFEAVARQRDEQGLYNLVDNMPSITGEFDNVLRIKREVDKKIEEIACLEQREVVQESLSSMEQKENTNFTKKKPNPVNAGLSGARRIEQQFTNRPSNAGKKTIKKLSGKENIPQKKSSGKVNLPAKKDSKKNKSQVPSSVTTAQKQVYLSSVYGRQPYHPHRTTSKAPYLHYQSPVNPKTAAIISALQAGHDSGAMGKQFLHEPTSLHEKAVVEPRKKKAHITKPSSSPYSRDGTKYYFQPQVGASYLAPEDEKVVLPLEGQLVPMAIPLGKPKTDPALRPPVPTQDTKHISTELAAESPSPDDTLPSHVSGTQTPVPSPVRPIKRARPNVAVITLYDKELVQDTTHQNKQHKKSSRRKKESSQLAVQVLPTLDIDSLSDRTASSSPSLPLIDDHIPKPVSLPDDSEYQEFRTFLAVRETCSQEGEEEQAAVDTDEDFHRIPTPQHPVTLEGLSGTESQSYHGPPFPPVHPPVSVQQPGGVLEADTRQGKALQERAIEWIEQELLARIVSEMSQPVPDPTSLARLQATPESSIVSDPESDDADMLSAAAIGLGGVQLFVDAGIPVDRDLVSTLIREVIAENISTVIGHPKPRAMPLPSASVLEEEEHSGTPPHRETPLPTPTPTPEYTPPESEESVHESPVIATPVRTPTPSVTSEELTVSGSRDEEKVFEPISEEQKQDEEIGEQISESKSPMSTPIVTPPPPQSPPVSISTPEPSVKEAEVSQDTLVPTPTPSIAVKMPTPELEPEPELSVAEEPSQPKEPSVSEKELTPPKPAQPSASSPSSLSSTTLGTTTITTEEDMSDGEMIQPYVHAGVYSEGEFAISPSVVQLAAQRKVLLQGNWDSTSLGQDQDSHNELVRKAFKGLLQRGDDGRRRNHDNSSSSASDFPYQASSASTLRDTQDIREDSITDVSDREPGEIRPRDPMAVLLSRIQNYSQAADSSASEGELQPEHLCKPYPGREIGGVREPGEIVPGNLSPGEVVSREPPGAVRISSPFLKESEVDDRPLGLNRTNSRVAQIDAQRRVEGEPSHDDRSLHASDLLPGTLGIEFPSFASAKEQQPHPKPKAIQVERSESKLSEVESLHDTYSVENHRREALVLNVDNNTERETSEQDRLDIGEERSAVAKQQEKSNEPQQPTKINVTLPSVNSNVHEESSLASGVAGHVSPDLDTFGDVSSISGGDF